MCEDDLTDETYFNAVMKEAQEFCAYLCKKFGFGVDKISSHHESYLQGYGGNHGDPENWLKPFGKTMDWFRSEVQKLLDIENAPEKPASGVLYRVQVGAYSVKSNADNMLNKLKAAGFEAFITTESGTAVAIESVPVKKSVTEIAKEVINGKWGKGVDRKNRLVAAGYNYSEVQTMVNKLLK